MRGKREGPIPWKSASFSLRLSVKHSLPPQNTNVSLCCWYAALWRSLETYSCVSTPLTLGIERLALKHESRIIGHSSNPVCGFSMMKQVRLCCLAHRELACLFHEPDTGLDHCLRILLSCFRARTSVWESGKTYSTKKHSQLLLLQVCSRLA